MAIKEFEKNGKIYEIRKIDDGNVIKVRVFSKETGKPVSVIYSTTDENVRDLMKLKGEDMLNEIADIAENDFLKLNEE